MWHYTKVKVKQSLYWPLAFQDNEATRFQDNRHVKVKQSLYWPLAFQDNEATRFQDNRHVKDLS
jgi:hypothetical protein